VLTPPDALDDGQLEEALRRGWGLSVTDLTYVPAGFGSFHWTAVADRVRWFVTVDDLDTKRGDGPNPRDDARRRLSAALSTARELRDGGMSFVVAPLRTQDDAILHASGNRFAVALYPHVDGEAHSWGAYPTRRDRLAVLDLIAVVHAAPERMRRVALVDDHVIPDRSDLVAAMSDLDEPWAAGPFAEPARKLLATHVDRLGVILRRYDRLAAEVAGRPERLVLTHGEPHRGNTITTADGVVLIDWDTTLVAPPERDLWSLADEDARVLDDYRQRTGNTPDVESLTLYRLWWDLAEISGYLSLFRSPHRETEDTRLAWDSFVGYLDSSTSR
jgi:hypothetical protein